MNWDTLAEEAYRFGGDKAELNLHDVQVKFLASLDPSGDLEIPGELALLDILELGWSEEQQYCDTCEARITGMKHCPDCEES